MVTRATLTTLIGAAFLLTCRSSSTPRAASASPRGCEPIARREVLRHAGVGALEPCLSGGDGPSRRRALRALGRIGDAAALARLRAVPADWPEVWTARALAGLAPEPKADLRGLDGDARAAVLWSIGRAEGTSDHAQLARGLADPDPAVRAWAGIALGLLGRAEKPLSDTLRSKLVALGQESNAAVRYGAAYAWAREFEPPPNSPGGTALRALLRDSDAEIRALAWSGLGRRGLLEGAPLRDGLRDRDWRVRVEVIRAATSPQATPTMRAELVTWLDTRPLDREAAHDWLTALDGLQSAAGEEAVRARLAPWTTATAAALEGDDAVLASAAHCLATAARVRAGSSLSDVESCGGAAEQGLPMAERRRVWAELVRRGVGGDVRGRLTSFERFRADPDPRVRAQVISLTLSSEDLELRDAASRAAVEALARAEDGTDSVVVGSIADAIAGDGLTPNRELERALLARLNANQRDAEVTISLLNALRMSSDPLARASCKARARDPNPAVRSAALDVLHELSGETLASAPEEVPPAPPLDIEALQGRTVLWRLRTTRGDIEIALDPEVAPWSVAALVELTERGFYHDLSWHRVVPNFVVQGGDPTGSGWGGPGFTLPTEASALPFVRGAVGIADAGKDTGGSQFFITHARAPHLEGRYTLVGYVVHGMEVVDQLLVGDRLLDAEVEVRGAEGS